MVHLTSVAVSPLSPPRFLASNVGKGPGRRKPTACCHYVMVHVWEFTTHHLLPSSQHYCVADAFVAGVTCDVDDAAVRAPAVADGDVGVVVGVLDVDLVGEVEPEHVLQVVGALDDGEGAVLVGGTLVLRRRPILRHQLHEYHLGAGVAAAAGLGGGGDVHDVQRSGVLWAGEDEASDPTGNLTRFAVVGEGTRGVSMVGIFTHCVYNCVVLHAWWSASLPIPVPLLRRQTYQDSEAASQQSVEWRRVLPLAGVDEVCGLRASSIAHPTREWMGAPTSKEFPRTISSLGPGSASRLERLASPPSRTRFDSWWGQSQIFASENGAVRCRWLACFLRDIPFPPPLHSGVASYPHRFTHDRFQYLVVKSSANFSTPLHFNPNLESLTELGITTSVNQDARNYNSVLQKKDRQQYPLPPAAIGDCYLILCCDCSNLLTYLHPHSLHIILHNKLYQSYLHLSSDALSPLSSTYTSPLGIILSSDMVDTLPTPPAYTPSQRDRIYSVPNLAYRQHCYSNRPPY
ncbi:hypothetical protein PR048_015031 [Dryococelus australis]|uniref:Uncharacterized protein n=1 Tax=Dryococelus australis TaxID=614101 RepID=A0ABQ9HGB1_9NEOP|nr:hypothetical protein PR048_015031 [Dryococelus australis]